MGIKNLNKFIKDKSNESISTVHLSNFAFKKIAIDISLFLYKYKCILGPKWLEGFVNLISCLRKNNIHCVFIYDGTFPIEKIHEQEKRKKEREKLEQNIFTLENAINEYYNTNILPDVIKEFYKKNMKSKSESYSESKSESDSDIDIGWVEDKIKQKKNQIINIDSNDINLTKNLFDILKIPYLTAPWEAEKLCSKLCIDGSVDAVLSEDSDVIAYGAPIFLFKIDINQSTVNIIENDILLHNLNLNYSQLLDLCIMCGTDYNENIPRIGPHSSYKYISNYKKIEYIPNIDSSILNYKRVRELFTTFDDHETGVNIEYCGIPDFIKLEQFIIENELNINIDYIRYNFIQKIFFT